jgi:glycine/D-amino acid oxidase-like deaminating enzyme
MGQLIIGIYGMSTALWMLREGGYEVTILDRCEELPALDAASTGMFISLCAFAPKSLWHMVRELTSRYQQDHQSW